MTNTQILGTVSLVLGLGMLLQRRNTATAAAASSDIGKGSGADLWPDLPSVLGTIGDRLTSFVTGIKAAGNASSEPATPASQPLNVTGWTPSPGLDEYLPPSPMNPMYGEPGETVPQGGDPNLDPYNDAAYADLAWFHPPGTNFAPAPPGTEEYLSPGA